MKFDYTKLYQKMIEMKVNQSQLAAMIGMKEPTLSNKLSSTTYFKQSEINRICTALKISRRKISEYFFVLEVQ